MTHRETWLTFGDQFFQNIFALTAQLIFWALQRKTEQEFGAFPRNIKSLFCYGFRLSNYKWKIASSHIQRTTGF